MAVCKGNDIDRKVLKVLGLEGRPITKLVLTIEANCVAEVQITEMVERADDEELAEVLSDFYLTPKTDANG